MRITAKGQVTIPRDTRERAGLVPGADVEFEIRAGVVRLVKTIRGRRRKTRGQKLADRLRRRRLQDDHRRDSRAHARPAGGPGCALRADDCRRRIDDRAGAGGAYLPASLSAKSATVRA